VEGLIGSLNSFFFSPFPFIGDRLHRAAAIASTNADHSAAALPKPARITERRAYARSRREGKTPRRQVAWSRSRKLRAAVLKYN